jgi:hypothetical protein
MAGPGGAARPDGAGSLGRPATRPVARPAAMGAAPVARPAVRPAAGAAGGAGAGLAVLLEAAVPICGRWGAPCATSAATASWR